MHDLAHIVFADLFSVLIAEAGQPCADISTTIARHSFTRSLAVRVIFCRHRPSFMDQALTNTSGVRTTTTSQTQTFSGQGLARSLIEINNPSKVRRRDTSPIAHRGLDHPKAAERTLVQPFSVTANR
ncbi:hypothetical protein DP939_35610 [Spongiactinospora rosea]|uniref:Uncharacterized protein n=1 Tax=Spongiactinospora rosea TaxID=2248750 RepID=A0A366LQ23_9ACTN|nr:hypothetical protein [Spongiactinospora rosea]RBQ15424.1 hypothetical protein DP939_35610 [Spongiactinospora rosea]